MTTTGCNRISSLKHGVHKSSHNQVFSLKHLSNKSKLKNRKLADELRMELGVKSVVKKKILLLSHDGDMPPSEIRIPRISLAQRSNPK